MSTGPSPPAGAGSGARLGGHDVTGVLGERHGRRELRGRSPAGDDVVVRTARGAAGDALDRDARRLMSLTHPALLPVVASGRDPDCTWAARPDVPGRELGAALRPRGAPRRIARDLAEALDALAAAGMAPRPLDAGCVVPGARGARLDPLAAPLGAPDPRRTAAELGAVLEAALPAGADPEARRVAAAAAGGTFASPAAVGDALPSAPRARRALGIAVAALVPAAVVAGVVAATRDGSPPPPTPSATAPTTAPVAPPPARPVPRAPRPAPGARITATVPLGFPAASVAAAGGEVWVAGRDGRVVRLAAGGPTPVALPQPASGPVGLAAGRAGTWALDAGTGTVSRIRPGGSGGWVRPGGGPLTVVAAGDAVWAAGPRGAGGRLVVISAGSIPSAGPEAPLPAAPVSLAAAAAVVVAGGGGGRVTISGPGRAPRTVRAGRGAPLVAAAGRRAWAADPATRRVTVIPLAGGAPRRGFRTTGRPVAIAVSGRWGWVVTRGPRGAAVQRFDAARATAAGAPLRLPAAGPVAAGGDAAWVAAGARLVRLAPAGR